MTTHTHNDTILDLRYKANYDGKTVQMWASENTALRNEIARLNGGTRWQCKCGGTDCKGQRENERLRGLLADLADEG